MRLFVDNLTNVDFSYLCPRRGLVGETWLAHIELSGELDQQGMICDFGVVKKELRNWLDTWVDHRLLVPTRHRNARCTPSAEMVAVDFELNSGAAIAMRAPAQATTLVDCETINCDSVAKWCVSKLTGVLDNVQQVQLRFTPEAIEEPYYHYSHGLKKHSGNCQRIAHGHRSKILVWRNGQLCEQTMRHWAERWQDIYIASNEDCVSKDDTSASFAYESQQGNFQLTLPVQQCYFIDTDTTVEYLAQHLADEISRQHPGDRIEVKAFEGVGKGAFAEAGG